MRAKRVHALKVFALKTQAPIGKVKYAWKHRHIDAAPCSPDRAPAAPDQNKKCRFKGFRKNQPHYNKALPNKPVRSTLVILNMTKASGLMQKVWRDRFKIGSLPKLEMISVLKRYIQGEGGSAA